MRGPLALAIGVAALSVAYPAHADPLPLDLRWEAPAECPSGERVQRELTRITRPRPGRLLVALAASGAIMRSGHGYHLVLQTERGGMAREGLVDSPTCEPLLRVVTLMLALAYGDGVDIHESEAPAAPATQPKPHSLPDKWASLQPVLTPHRGERGSLEVTPWVGALSSSGLVGRLALGGEVGVQVGSRGWLVGLRASATPQTEAARRDSLSAELSAFSTALGGCGQAKFAMLRVGACARIEAGILRARSEGARVNGAASVGWFALVPTLSV